MQDCSAGRVDPPDPADGRASSAGLVDLFRRERSRCREQDGVAARREIPVRAVQLPRSWHAQPRTIATACDLALCTAVPLRLRESEQSMIAKTIIPDIPDRFWKIPYDTAHDRDSPTLMRIETGANCQNFAYELLRHFGRHVPNLRSSNLSVDTEYTIVADKYEPLDLLLFNRTHNAWGAHIAVYAGDDRATHLCRRIGFAAVWLLAQFTAHSEYCVLIDAKRALSTNSNCLCGP